MSVDVVLDTNVIVEVSTIADLNREAAGITTADAADPTTSKLHYRRQRVRASLALAWWMHRGGRTSMSLKDEAMRRVVELSRPATANAVYPAFFTWFLKDHVLPGWKMMVADDPTYDDVGLSGNNRDRVLVRLAREEHAPLVTNEAGPKGAVMKAAALAPPVAVFKPADFLVSQGEDETSLASELLEASAAALVGFVAERDPRNEDLIRNAKAYYRALEWIVTGS